MSPLIKITTHKRRLIFVTLLGVIALFIMFIVILAILFPPITSQYLKLPPTLTAEYIRSLETLTPMP